MSATNWGTKPLKNDVAADWVASLNDDYNSRAAGVSRADVVEVWAGKIVETWQRWYSDPSLNNNGGCQEQRRAAAELIIIDTSNGCVFSQELIGNMVIALSGLLSDNKWLGTWDSTDRIHVAADIHQQINKLTLILQSVKLTHKTSQETVLILPPQDKWEKIIF